MVEVGLAAALAAFLEASVRIATPLALAALGETVTERSGVLNIGLEGTMLCGALAAALGSLWAGAPLVGLSASAFAGAAVAALFALFVIGVRADHIVAGTAITLGAIGMTGAVYRAFLLAPGASLAVPSFAPVPVPLLSGIPLVGAALFSQPAPVYLLMVLIPAVWFVLGKTTWGLRLRACGEHPEAVKACGRNAAAIRFVATVVGGVMGGLAGGTLVLAQAGTFAERMTAGRGFIAIAIVVLGRWNPLGVAAAALLFGAASALQYAFQAAGLEAPYQAFLMIPYLITLLALAGIGGRAEAPAALGRS